MRLPWARILVRMLHRHPCIAEMYGVQIACARKARPARSPRTRAACDSQVSRGRMNTLCPRYCLVPPLLMQAGAHDATPAQDKLAQYKLVLAVGQRGAWDTAVAEIGSRAGIFKT